MSGPGRGEIAKDVAQTLAESAATHGGRIAAIVAGAIRGVVHELGEWASDAFEMREAAQRARSAERSAPLPGDLDDVAEQP